MKITTLLTMGMSLLFTVGLTACGSTPSEETSKEDEEPKVNMTASYQKGREEFKKVTGVELPALENLEAENYPYQEGTTDYCFDITGGTALNYQTYQIFENFFLEKVGQCTTDYPFGDEENGRDAQWVDENSRWYQTFWDATNKGIYINTRILTD